jgi:hypothetical protein
MEKTSNELHLNPPQLDWWLGRANTNVLLWGRGTGKTEGPVAMFTLDNVLSMPRSNGAMIGSTYEQLLTRTLPPVIAGWEKMGYREGEHFFVKKFAPERWKWDKAFKCPLKAEHYIQWYNGSGIYLVSQDRKGTSNGLSLDWFSADEAKLLNKDQINEETIPAMRGNADFFGKLFQHHSTLYASDKPKGQSGRWLFDYLKNADYDVMRAILYMSAQSEKMKAGKQERAFRELSIALNALRKKATFCSVASTLDNIDTLGLDVIENLAKSLPDIDFMYSVLNLHTDMVENSFYALLDDSKHTYDAVEYGYVDTLQFEREMKKDCRWDKDVNPDEALDIAMDYNAAINSMVVGQPGSWGGEYKIVNAIYVLHPQRLKDAVIKFTDYYKHHRTKKVRYWFDHTAVGTTASTDVCFADEVTGILKAQGWRVEKMYIGQAASHRARHFLFEQTFREDAGKLKLRINRGNGMQLIDALQNARIKQTTLGVGKDKTDEKNARIAQDTTTHLTDALDTLWWGLNMSNLSAKHNPVRTVM